MTTAKSRYIFHHTESTKGSRGKKIKLDFFMMKTSPKKFLSITDALFESYVYDSIKHFWTIVDCLSLFLCPEVPLLQRLDNKEGRRKATPCIFSLFYKISRARQTVMVGCNHYMPYKNKCICTLSGKGCGRMPPNVTKNKTIIILLSRIPY